MVLALLSRARRHGSRREVLSYTLCCICRAVARSENPGGHIGLSGDNVPPLVEIGLTGLPKTGGGAQAPLVPPLATGLDNRRLATYG